MIDLFALRLCNQDVINEVTHNGEDDLGTNDSHYKQQATFTSSICMARRATSIGNTVSVLVNTI